MSLSMGQLRQLWNPRIDHEAEVTEKTCRGIVFRFIFRHRDGTMARAALFFPCSYGPVKWLHLGPQRGH